MASWIVMVLNGVGPQYRGPSGSPFAVLPSARSPIPSGCECDWGGSGNGVRPGAAIDTKILVRLWGLPKFHASRMNGRT